VLLLAALQPRRARWDDDRVPDAPWLGQPLGGIPAAWADPAVRSLVLAGALFNVMHVALTAFTVNLLVQDAAYALVAAGVVSGLAQLGGAAGRVMLGFAADRMRDSLTILWVAGALMTVMCLVTGTVGPHWPPAAMAALFLAFGFIGIGWNGVFHGQLARLSPPGGVGLVSSGAGFFLFLTALAGPSLFAALYAALGSYTSTFAVLAFAPLAGLALARRAQLAARRRTGAPSRPPLHRTR
jgi:predicted MFS family arabinose efflux permease